MGSKKNKLKQMISPPTSSPPPPQSTDDAELMDDLLAQLDSRDQSVQKESAVVLEDMKLDQVVAQEERSGKSDSKSRFKARQAKKVAALAAQQSPVDEEADARLEREAKDEEKAINRICDDLGLDIYEISPDGHCLFAAIADQLTLLSLLPAAQSHYATVRHAAANYMLAHPDDFMPFLPSVTGEDGAGAGDGGLMRPDEYAHYCGTIRDTGVWGGEPEILALSRAFNVPIHVVQGAQPPVVVHDPSGEPKMDNLKEQKAVRISYHRRMYGLGEHYNSLRPRTGLHKITSPLKHMLS
ncbi:cysteine proteinase [Auriscalpium vulgare]|uniref:Cysteine proteinase n=1 Tax=Auriscalpium vulgare TaxID=40419 RepID=A0ACB8RQ18_9AGAM|nr:cysteine proteinase [Auriscalpium vulgare]